MKISNAELTPDGIKLTVPLEDARRFVYHFKAGEYEITKARKKRSLDANAYAWKLINDIALATRISPEEVYKISLEDVPTRRYELEVDPEDVDTVIADWQRGHIGRRAEVQLSYSEYVTVIFHSGSSDFDTRQMSILINNLIQDCKALGIETRDPNDIKSMLEAWNGKMG